MNALEDLMISIEKDISDREDEIDRIRSYIFSLQETLKQAKDEFHEWENRSMV